MAYARIYNRHGYILDFIKRNSRPTTEDIVNFLHGLGEGVDERTVQRDIKTIENELDYVIERKGSHPNRWYEIVEEPEEKTLVSRYLEHAGLAEILRKEATKKHDQRRSIYLDETQMTEGLGHVPVILEAIKNSTKLNVSHCKFGGRPTERKVCPLFLKQYLHRWYLLASEDESGKTKSFGLDRILKIEVTDETFQFTEQNGHDAMYGHVIGLYGNEEAPETIRLWSETTHAGYLRSVKLHHSQREVGESEKGVIFELHVVPNYEFFQLILMMESRVCILSPSSAIDRMKAMLVGILKRYGE
ncbi:MAG: WYL domain-containing protein [Flavobacteriales bacterium]|nr:WYL domain-containing protein [Flavobacteriales bacterium]